MRERGGGRNSTDRTDHWTHTYANTHINTHCDPVEGAAMRLFCCLNNVSTPEAYICVCVGRLRLI